MIGIIILFLTAALIFGVAFNFGVLKNKNKPITCDDPFCDSCPGFSDVCKECNTNYSFDSKK